MATIVFVKIILEQLFCILKASVAAPSDRSSISPQSTSGPILWQQVSGPQKHFLKSYMRGVNYG